MNSCILSGLLGKDAEVKEICGRLLTTFSLATTRKKNNEQVPDWHRVNYWSNENKLAIDLLKGTFFEAQWEVTFDT